MGRIFVPELILIGLLPFLLMTRGRLLADPLPRTFLMLAALWLASQVLTDLIRETDFRDYSRGQVKIVFTAANFCALYMLLYGSRRRLVLFALGAGDRRIPVVPSESFDVLGGSSLEVRRRPARRPARGPDPTVASDPASPVSAGPAAPGRERLQHGGGIPLHGGHRPPGLALRARAADRGPPAPGRRWPSRLAGRCCSSPPSPALTPAVLTLYEQAVARGYMSERALQTYERQASGSFGVLLGGRSEIYTAARA